MTAPAPSLEDLIRASTKALVIGVGGGGDVVGALATGRFLEFCGLEFVLGGLSWERNVYDPIPGPRKQSAESNQHRRAVRRSQDGRGATAKSVAR
jgi:hypothetical protein